MTTKQAAKRIREEKVRTLAQLALGAWLRGMLQGGHTPSREDIAATFNTALEHYRGQA